MYLKLDHYHGFFNIMPDFIGKLKKDVISNDKKPRFLKNLKKIYSLDKKLNKTKKIFFLKIAKTESQPGHSLILFLKFWQISGSCLL